MQQPEESPRRPKLAGQKQNQGIRDENAEQCVRIYDKLFESLRSNPHFRCRISAYANHPDLAKMILDAAASEAVEEGRSAKMTGSSLPRA